jgi:hypothetical protein
MNKNRRDAIQKIIVQLNNVAEVIYSILDEEQDCFDAFPENLQGSEKGEKAETAIGFLEDAKNNIDEAIENLESASE